MDKISDPGRKFRPQRFGEAMTHAVKEDEFGTGDGGRGCSASADIKHLVGSSVDH